MRANAARSITIRGKEIEGIDAGKLWKEMKEWRKHWKPSRFFRVLIFGLAASLFDSATDFNFAWSVPKACGLNTTECSVQHFDLDRVSSPCGRMEWKNVERATFTFIAFPGFFLGFSGLQSLVAALIAKFWKGEIPKSVRGPAGVFAVALECSLVVGLLLAASGLDGWPCEMPRLAEVYDCILQGMAYLSTFLIIGVKCLATFCHGPESCRLGFMAKEAETKFEAALQLGLLFRIYLSSGIGTSAGLLSAISSIFMICKNGVENFLQRHREELAEASVLGKILVAASVLPLFLLTAVFKLGAFADNRIWKGTMAVKLFLLGLGLPNLLILTLRLCNLLKDLPLANVNQCVLSDVLTLHLWPKSRTGRRVALTMTVFTFLLFALPAPFIIASPEPTTQWTGTEGNNTDYTDWAAEAGDRLQVAATLLLLVGSVAFVWAIHLILYEDQWVAKIVFNFPKHSKPADDGIKGPPVDIDPKDTMTTIPGRIIDSDRASNSSD